MALIGNKAAHDPITASWANQIRDQTIQITTSGARPGSPTEGFVIWETDTNLLKVYDGSNWVDLVANASGAWSTYTPTWTQSGTISKTVDYAEYMQIGKLVTCRGLLTQSGGGTGTAGNSIVLSLPVTASYAGAKVAPIGEAFFFDSSLTAYYPGFAVLQSTTTFGIVSTATAGINNYLGVAEFTSNVFTGDQISWTIQYRAA